MRSVFLLMAACCLAAGCSSKPTFSTNDQPQQAMAKRGDALPARTAPARRAVSAGKPVTSHKTPATSRAASRSGLDRTVHPESPRVVDGKGNSGSSVAAATSQQNASPSSSLEPQSPRAQLLRVVGSDEGSSASFASDLEKVIADQLDLRRVQTGGPRDNMLALMRSQADIGIVDSNVGPTLSTEAMRNAARDRVRYITKLYTKDMHVLAPREVTDVRQLDLRKVNIGRPGSSTNSTARQLFERLGVRPLFEESDHASALEKLHAGQIHAALILERRPAAMVQSFRADARFHLVPIPHDNKAAQIYSPGQLNAKDYPDLVQSGGHVETVAVATVLAVANVPERSERHQRLAEFTKLFFSHLDDLREIFYPMWIIEPSAVVEGWQRFKPAEEMLQNSALPSADEK